MKVCNNCGNNVNDGNVFCDNCGARVEDAHTDYAAGNNGANQNGGYSQSANYGQAPNYGQVPNYGMPMGGYNAANNMPNQNGFPVSVGGWIGRSLLLSVVLCIPIIGWIAYFVMLAVWAGDQSKEQTFRNWAKAQLWVILIIVAIILILFLILGAAGAALLGSHRYY